VEFDSNKLYKSTLISQLNCNPFLSKDRLARVKNFVYFNNVDSYLSAAESTSTCLLGLGSNCEVYFETNCVVPSSRVGASKATTSRAGEPRVILDVAYNGEWYIGRVQRIQRHVGKKWGTSRQPIDMMNRPNAATRKASRGVVLEVMLNWFSKPMASRRFKYNSVDTTWVNVNSVISIVSLSYKKAFDVYWLDIDDYENMCDFVKDQL
jgi:hypothetical protein